MLVLVTGLLIAIGPRETVAVDLRVEQDESRVQLHLGDGEAFHTTARQVNNARVVEVPNSTVTIALWNEVLPSGANSAYYAISLDGRNVARVQNTSYKLKLRAGVFDPAASAEPAMNMSLRAGDANNLYLVQFITQPLGEYLASIEALGGTVRKYVPDHTHIVEMNAETRDQVAALPFVRWVGSYHPAYKLEAFMRDNVDRAEQLFPLRQYNILVFETGYEQRKDVAALIQALGGTVNASDAGKYLMEATLTPAQLFAVANLDQVAYI
ncbi:MAG: hypothetical protein O7B26_07470, partial [Planctomycetota bacterium]|nr:hypothetical protein [Planctomycetota bacterium]